MLAPKGLYVSIHFQIVSALGFYRFVQPFCNDITLFRGVAKVCLGRVISIPSFSHMQESGRTTTKTAAAAADGNGAAATENGKAGKKKQVGSRCTKY